jgi:hypothetical protein
MSQRCNLPIVNFQIILISPFCRISASRSDERMGRDPFFRRVEVRDQTGDGTMKPSLRGGGNCASTGPCLRIHLAGASSSGNTITS